MVKLRMLWWKRKCQLISLHWSGIGYGTRMCGRCIFTGYTLNVLNAMEFFSYSIIFEWNVNVDTYANQTITYFQRKK